MLWAWKWKNHHQHKHIILWKVGSIPAFVFKCAYKLSIISQFLSVCAEMFTEMYAYSHPHPKTQVHTHAHEHVCLCCKGFTPKQKLQDVISIILFNHLPLWLCVPELLMGLAYYLFEEIPWQCFFFPSFFSFPDGCF